MSYALRPYQVAAEDAIHRELDARHRALAVLATGAGKTILFAAVAERRRPRGRALVLAHREELLDQAAEKIAASTLLSTGIEQGDRRLSGTLPDVVIASVPTLAHERRRAAFDRHAFGLVIVDEAHHGTATTYRTVLDHFGSADRLGVTATPDRADGESLRSVFGNTVFRYGIRTAVRDGFLVDVRRAVEQLPADLSRVRVRAGDYDAADLEQELVKAPAVAAVAEAIVRRAGDRPTVAFCAGVLHSRAVATALNALRPGMAAAASGEDREGLARLTRGEVQVCTNADLAVEGFDYRPLACVALVRPTKSTGRATQQVGRGTRLSPETGKRDLLVIEFAAPGASEQVTTVGVIGADLPATTRAAAERLLDARPGLSVLDALDQAAAGAGSTHVGAARRQRAVLDPMSVILRLDGMVMETPRAGAPPATPAQLVLLANEGLHVAGCDVRQAAMLLQGIRWRRSRGRCTPTQALELARYGFDTESSARDALARLAQMRSAA